MLIFFSSGVVFAGAYCNGYEEGYKSGFQKAIRIPGYDPMVPLCSLKPISKFEQTQRDYQDGYRQGYKEGVKEGKEQDE